jgi:hypothetical protein
MELVVLKMELVVMWVVDDEEDAVHVVAFSAKTISFSFQHQFPFCSWPRWHQHTIYAGALI